MLFLTLAVLAQNAPALPKAEASAPNLHHGASTVIVRCPRECTVLVAGKGGKRLAVDQWEFVHVAAGQTRIDATGTLGLAMAAGFATIAANARVTLVISGNRLVVTDTSPLAPSTRPENGGAVSVLHFTCQKPCTISVDGQRKSGEGVRSGTVADIKPGDHVVAAKFLGASAQSTLRFPPASDVFVAPTDSSVNITTTRPRTTAP